MPNRITGRRSVTADRLPNGIKLKIKIRQVSMIRRIVQYLQGEFVALSRFETWDIYNFKSPIRAMVDWELIILFRLVTIISLII